MGDLGEMISQWALFVSDLFFLLIVVIILVIFIISRSFHHLVRNWLKERIKVSNMRFGHLYFILKDSEIDFFHLSNIGDVRLLIGYILDPAGNPSQRERMSCIFLGDIIHGPKRFEPIRKASYEPDSRLADVLNYDEELMKKIYTMRNRLNGLRVYFTKCDNPFEEPPQEHYAWAIELQLWMFWANKKSIGHMIEVMDRIRYLLRSNPQFLNIAL